jgi:hypothetical protein
VVRDQRRAGIGASGRAGAAIAVLLLVVVAGCSGSSGDCGDEADGGDHAEMTTTTTDPRSPAVLQAYEAYWSAMLASADPPAPESEALSQYAAGDELEHVRSALADLDEAGDVLRGRFDHAASVTSIEDREAVVTDCLAPRTTTLDAATGQVIVGESSGSGLVTARMVLDGEAWKVALIEDGEGACPAEGTPPEGTPAGG